MARLPFFNLSLGDAMKRLAGFTCLAALLMATCATHYAWSLPPAGTKQKICHFEKGATTGTVLEIAKPAIAAHCKNHGDTTVITPANAAVGAACTKTTGAACVAAP
jgi:hypothetical protein